VIQNFLKNFHVLFFIHQKTDPLDQIISSQKEMPKNHARYILAASG
jgi:hypothetical protein